ILTQIAFFFVQPGLRQYFLTHDDTKPIKIQAPSSGKLWPGVLDTLTNISKTSIRPQFQSWINPNFTTTTSQDAKIYQITLLYPTVFSSSGGGYEKLLIPTNNCGIPEITLKGTTEDWKWMLEK